MSKWFFVWGTGEHGRASQVAAGGHRCCQVCGLRCVCLAGRHCKAPEVGWSPAGRVQNAISVTCDCHAFFALDLEVQVLWRLRRLLRLPGRNSPWVPSCFTDKELPLRAAVRFVRDEERSESKLCVGLLASCLCVTFMSRKVTRSYFTSISVVVPLYCDE